MVHSKTQQAIIATWIERYDLSQHEIMVLIAYLQILPEPSLFAHMKYDDDDMGF